MEEKILVYLMEVKDDGTVEKGRFVEIENTLESKQGMVKGLIEVISLTSEIDLIVNEEGKIQHLPYNRALVDKGVVYDILVGNIIACRFDDEGNFASIRKDDEEIIKLFCKPVYHIDKRIIIGEEG